MSSQRPEPWRKNIESKTRQRGSAEQRAATRRLTLTTAAAAAGLNVVLFMQAGVQQIGPGDFQQAVIAAVNGLFPGAGLRPSAAPPTPSPGGTGIVSTGGS